ncbi:MAG: hypothetical protein KA369_03325 [Spirochaetes bacterium]|nr:hypothetical protein [Spirochaetota bacterium]
MKRTVSSVLPFALSIIFSLAFSCSDSERHLPYVGKNAATVVIQLSLPGEETATNRSMVDRILRFFTRDAMAQTAPAAFSSYTVNVTAAGIPILTQTFTSTDTLTFTVPAGSARRFEVIANVSAGDPSAALSFRGITTLDLAAGQTVTVPVIMIVNETKIVIPDYRMAQLVQIDSLETGNATWKINALGYGFNANFYDVDFDARGRIYIGRYSPGLNNYVVIRINNMDSSTYDIIVNSSTGVNAIAIDRSNNYLYYATSATTSALYRVRCNTGETPTALYTATAPIQTIRGMAFDGSENVLYMAGVNNSGQQAIFKYSLNTLSVINTYVNATQLYAPWHVLIKDPYIYVANLNGANGYRILMFNKNLDFLQGYGNGTTSINTTQGWFYGPRRFLAILNRKITIIDDDDAADVDKLISMDNINGDGWTTYGSYSMSAGTGYFKFYYGT